MILMNIGYFKENPPDNTIPPWLLPCCLHPDLLCVRGSPYLNNPPTQIETSLTIQFIEFTYTNDQYLENKSNAKIAKYQPLIHDIQALGWNVTPLMVIYAGIKGTTHTTSINTIHTTYKFF
jgi:hypothetical protein